MKIKSVKVLNDGLDEDRAERIWEQTEANANYQFNKSHSVEYSIISVWCAYIRVHYPAEYFAASLSIVGEDKLTGLVKDARECGIEVLPPEINVSSHRYTIPDNSTILAPFSAVKGVSEMTAKAIVRLREMNRDWKIVRYKRNAEKTPEYGYDMEAKVKGRFESFEEFKLAAEQPKSKVNSRVVESLRLVGTFSLIEEGEAPARDMSRRKDQMELLPGLVIDSIKADRITDTSEPFLRSSLVEHMKECKTCGKCDLSGQAHPNVRLGRKMRFMVITDCPTWEEEKKGQLLEGEASQFIKAAIKEAGLAVGEGYYTTLVKAKKQDKFLSGDQINSCSDYLHKEIKLLNPAVIVALGSATIKHLLPDVKNSPSELVGKSFYDPKIDATIVCGLNAQQCLFDATKLHGLVKTFKEVAEIVN
jgi:uracil-DNA glycosylase family 4